LGKIFAIIVYVVYNFFIKPAMLPPNDGQNSNIRQNQSNQDDDYVDYEEVD